jgi:hypothetical protein
MNELELEHALEVRQGDVDEVLSAGIALRCRCGWEHVEAPPNRRARRHKRDVTLVYAMAARAEEAWQEHAALNRG